MRETPSTEEKRRKPGGIPQRFMVPHLLREIGGGPGGGAKQTSLPAAASEVLSRHEGQCGGAGAAPRSRGRSSGNQLQASSLRPPGEEERVIWSRQIPTSRGPLGVRVSSRLADGESGKCTGRTTSLPACVRACAPTLRRFSRVSLFSSRAGRGHCARYG